MGGMYTFDSCFLLLAKGGQLVLLVTLTLAFFTLVLSLSLAKTNGSGRRGFDWHILAFACLLRGLKYGRNGACWSGLVWSGEGCVRHTRRRLICHSLSLSLSLLAPLFCSAAAAASASAAQWSGVDAVRGCDGERGGEQGKRVYLLVCCRRRTRIQ